MNTKVRTVSTPDEARTAVADFNREGYVNDSIFILTHDKVQTSRIADATDTQTVGIEDEGFGNAVANLFRSQGDALRAKLQSLGISETDAGRLEKEMDQGRIVIVGWGGNLHYGNGNSDPGILFV